MPGSQNPTPPTPKEPDWFDRLPLRTRGLLMAIFLFAVSAGTFLLGVYEFRSGQPIVNMTGRSDWTDDFLISAGAFALGAAILAVALGWLKFAKPEDSGNQLPK